jgi:hypothetical protein
VEHDVRDLLLEARKVEDVGEVLQLVHNKHARHEAHMWVDGCCLLCVCAAVVSGMGFAVQAHSKSAVINESVFHCNKIRMIFT